MTRVGNAEPALGAADDASGQNGFESSVMDSSSSSKVTGMSFVVASLTTAWNVNYYFS